MSEYVSKETVIAPKVLIAAIMARSVEIRCVLYTAGPFFSPKNFLPASVLQACFGALLPGSW